MDLKVIIVNNENIGFINLQKSYHGSRWAMN